MLGTFTVISAVAAGPVPMAFGDKDLSLIWPTLTPAGVKLRLRATTQDDDRPSQRPYRLLPGQHLSGAAKRIRVIVSTLREAAWAEAEIPGRIP
jgi:hypothetical protein